MVVNLQNTQAEMRKKYWGEAFLLQFVAQYIITQE